MAENAGYTRAVKYGVTRDYILGLEAVLPRRRHINVGGRTVKNVTGYDLVSLIVGSEGTLAVVTKIMAEAAAETGTYARTCIFYLDDLVAAADLVVGIFESGIVPCAIEFMDKYEHQLRGRLPLRASADLRRRTFDRHGARGS